MPIVSLIFSLIVSLFATCLSAQATSFYERPFPDTVRDAPVIVRGLVGSSYANWAVGEDGSRRIYTFFDVQVVERFKGDAAAGDEKNLTIREMGGEKDGVGMQVAGSARFERGEDVVVFLGPKNSDGSHDVWGMMMGKFNLQKDDSGKDYLVGAATSENDHVQDQGGPQEERKWTLEALRNLIKSQASASADPKKAADNSGSSPPKGNESSGTGLSASPPAKPSPGPKAADPGASPIRTSDSDGSAGFIGLGILVAFGALAFLNSQRKR